jgi:hypothetical protein
MKTGSLFIGALSSFGVAVAVWALTRNFDAVVGFCSSTAVIVANIDNHFWRLRNELGEQHHKLMMERIDTKYAIIREIIRCHKP